MFMVEKWKTSNVTKKKNKTIYRLPIQRTISV